MQTTENYEENAQFYDNLKMINKSNKRGRSRQKKVRPFSTAKLIHSSNTMASKVYRYNLVNNPTLTENILDSFVTKFENSRTVSRMNHGLKRSMDINVKAKARVRNLIHLDFSYLDKEDLKLASAKQPQVNFDGHMYGI